MDLLNYQMLTCLLFALTLQASVICLEDNFEELQHILTELLAIYCEQVRAG
jgi:hypothetical protein